MKHKVYVSDPLPTTYAAAVLLNNEYSSMESRQWSEFRRVFLENELSIKGKLTCYYCGRDDLTLEGDTHHIATLDHIVPRSCGGKDRDSSNVVPCCTSCNQKKSSMSHDEFLSSEYLQKKKRYGQ